MTYGVFQTAIYECHDWTTLNKRSGFLILNQVTESSTHIVILNVEHGGVSKPSVCRDCFRSSASGDRLFGVFFIRDVLFGVHGVVVRVFESYQGEICRKNRP